MEFFFYLDIKSNNHYIAIQAKSFLYKVFGINIFNVLTLGGVYVRTVGLHVPVLLFTWRCIVLGFSPACLHPQCLLTLLPSHTALAPLLSLWQKGGPGRDLWNTPPSGPSCQKTPCGLGPGPNVTFPGRPSRALPEICQLSFSRALWLIIMFFIAFAPSAIILFISSCIDFPSALKECLGRGEVLLFLLTPV